MRDRRDTHRPRRRRAAPEVTHRCEVHGDCADPAVGYFVCESLFGERVYLWACGVHTGWWLSRHPDAVRVRHDPRAVLG